MLCGKISGHKKAFEKSSRLPLCVDVESYPNGSACEGRNLVMELYVLNHFSCYFHFLSELMCEGNKYPLCMLIIFEEAQYTRAVLNVFCCFFFAFFVFFLLLLLFFFISS